jgi:hypothetical protein
VLFFLYNEEMDDTERMKFYLDTEFIEDGLTIDLISLALVWDDGEYYAISTECNRDKANDWVKANVLPQLPLQTEKPELFRSRKQIADDIVQIVNKFGQGKPAFYGWYSDYDWVVFCQLFGSMINLPQGFPKYCRDIKQIADQLGNPKLPVQQRGKHDALEDVRWNKRAHEFLQDLQRIEGLYG